MVPAHITNTLGVCQNWQCAMLMHGMAVYRGPHKDTTLAMINISSLCLFYTMIMLLQTETLNTEANPPTRTLSPQKFLR